MSAWDIVGLSARHNCRDFDCGVDSLNTFLRQYAGQYQRKGMCRTRVVTAEGSNDVVGYYTFSGGGLELSDIPEDMARRLPRQPAPMVLLGRLAVDLRFQGRGVGGVLLSDALQRVRIAADLVGIFCVVVDALDDNAQAFYLANAFCSLADDPRHLMLPVAAIRTL